MPKRYLLILQLGISLMAATGCHRPSLEMKARIDELARSFDSIECETETDVRRIVSQAAAARYAILFIHFDWALMHQQQMRFAEFSVAYEEQFPESDVQFYYVDCTPVTSRHAPLVELDGWSDLEDPPGTSPIHGWGELAWLENGRVLHVKRILNFDSADDLIQKTADLFPGVK